MDEKLSMLQAVVEELIKHNDDEKKIANEEVWWQGVEGYGDALKNVQKAIEIIATTNGKVGIKHVPYSYDVEIVSL